MARALPTGVVTLVFTDIEGSSRLLEQAGPDYGGLLADHRRLLREAWHTHGGIEVDTQGDAFFVAFPTPQQGVRAASAAHAALAAHDWAPRLMKARPSSARPPGRAASGHLVISD